MKILTRISSVLGSMKKKVTESREQRRKVEESLIAAGISRRTARDIAPYVVRGDLTLSQAVRVARRVERKRERRIADDILRKRSRLRFTAPDLDPFDMFLGTSSGRRTRRRRSSGLEPPPVF